MVIRSAEDNDLTKATERLNGDNEIKGKVIRSARLARQILSKGQKDVWLFDVKPDRENKEKTCFVFFDDEKFQKVFTEVLEENRKNREDSETANLRRQLDEMQKKFDELLKSTSAKE